MIQSQDPPSTAAPQQPTQQQKAPLSSQTPANPSQTSSSPQTNTQKPKNTQKRYRRKVGPSDNAATNNRTENQKPPTSATKNDQNKFQSSNQNPNGQRNPQASRGRGSKRGYRGRQAPSGQPFTQRNQNHIPTDKDNRPLNTCLLPIQSGFEPKIPRPPVLPNRLEVTQDQLKEHIVKQIDYYFSPENLRRDMFLRRNMDTKDGWISVFLILSFNRIRELGIHKALFLEALKTSSVVEIQGDFIRKKGDWENWIILPKNDNQKEGTSSPSN
jgi:hypothetical protein